MPLYCTFRLGDLELGVDVLTVQEVIRYQPMTPVPLAPPAVTGLINLRGQIVTAIDLRTCFAMAGRAPGDALPINVVLRSDDGTVSLLVDEIGDVVEVGQATYEPPPDNLTGAVRGLVGGVHKLHGRLLLILDVASAMRSDPMTRSAA